MRLGKVGPGLAWHGRYSRKSRLDVVWCVRARHGLVRLAWMIRKPLCRLLQTFLLKPLSRGRPPAYYRGMTYSWLAPKRDRRHSCPSFAQPGTILEAGRPPC